jgi:hypothetical protein
MANYIINECITNDVYILSGVTPGTTVEFDISEARFCGTVGALTESAETLNISFVQLHDDCCACLSANRESLNFKFIRCGTDEDISMEAVNFCSGHTAPTTGLTYEIQFGTETPFCATFEGLSESGATNYFYVSGPFSLCGECEQEEEPPISAGTEVFICYENCSGGTVTISVQHPTWTNQYGQDVVLLDAIQLGGHNGYYN